MKKAESIKPRITASLLLDPQPEQTKFCIIAHLLRIPAAIAFELLLLPEGKGLIISWLLLLSPWSASVIYPVSFDLNSPFTVSHIHFSWLYTESFWSCSSILSQRWQWIAIIDSNNNKINRLTQNQAAKQFYATSYMLRKGKAVQLWIREQCHISDAFHHSP